MSKIKSPITTASTIFLLILMNFFLFGCVDYNAFKVGADTASSLTSELQPEEGAQEPPAEGGGGGGTQGYEYKGHCSAKFVVDKNSSLATELKNGDKACIEYSPKDFQGAGATGATVVIVSAVWCSPCKQLKTKFSELSDIAEKHKATVKIFLEKAATSAEVAAYGPTDFFVSKDLKTLEGVVGPIGGFPTILILDKYGKVAFRMSGFSSDVIAKLDEELSKL